MSSSGRKRTWAARRRASASTAPAPETWGTAAGYTTVPAFGLQAERPEFSTIIRDVSRARCNENTSPNDEVDARAVVQLPVPDGARLTLFQYWGYDTDPDLDLSYDVYETCQAPAAGPPVRDARRARIPGARKRAVLRFRRPEPPDGGHEELRLLGSRAVRAGRSRVRPGRTRGREASDRLGAPGLARAGRQRRSTTSRRAIPSSNSSRRSRSPALPAAAIPHRRSTVPTRR